MNCIESNQCIASCAKIFLYEYTKRTMLLIPFNGLKYWTCFFFSIIPWISLSAPVKQSRSWRRRRQRRMIRICALYVWFHYSQYLIRDVFPLTCRERKRDKKAKRTRSKTKKLWRLFEWSRSLSAAAAHHAHCILQFVLNKTDTSRRNQECESSIARYGCVWCACKRWWFSLAKHFEGWV